MDVTRLGQCLIWRVKRACHRASEKMALRLIITLSILRSAVHRNGTELHMLQTPEVGDQFNCARSGQHETDFNLMCSPAHHQIGLADGALEVDPKVYGCARGLGVSNYSP